MEPSGGATVIDSSPLVALSSGLSRGRTSRHVIATCLWLVVVANAVVIVWLWLHGAGVPGRQIHSERFALAA